ncbi:MAG: hypothetical protein P8M16_05340 [Acidimicrobiales bacterium]|nr:hypothetical protein [Acidimicrobiales bacterium]
MDPLRDIGRFLALGFAGAVLMSAGVVLLGVGSLRLLQQWSALEGSWSWVPYVVVAAFLGGSAVLAGSRILKSSQLERENGPA